MLIQRLALRRAFRTRQTLSALHDSSVAWLGVGAAAGALGAQLRVRTAPRGVLAIALYLGGVYVLHVTTPALFDVVPYNVSGTVTLTTSLGRVVPFQATVPGGTLVNESHLYVVVPSFKPC